MMLPILITTTIIAAIILFVIGVKIRAEKKRAEFDGLILEKMNELVAEMKISKPSIETESTETTQNESPASEDAKKVSYDPDFNPHPYTERYERFTDDAVDGVRDQLTTHQRIHLRGEK